MTFIRADQPRRQLPLDLLRCQLFEVASIKVGCVIDEHVKVTEPINSRLDGGLSVGGTGNVELDNQQVLRLTDGQAYNVDVAARGDDRVASSQGGFGDVHAHPTSSTSNQPDLLPTRGIFSTSLQPCLGCRSSCLSDIASLLSLVQLLSPKQAQMACWETSARFFMNSIIMETSASIPSLGPEQHLDGAAFVHGAVALGDLRPEAAQVEHLAGVDLPFQPGRSAQAGSGAPGRGRRGDGRGRRTVLAVQLHPVRDADEADVPAGAGGADRLLIDSLVPTHSSTESAPSRWSFP